MSFALRAAPRTGRWWGLRRLARDVGRGLRGHDLSLYAAGVTFYGGIALVPSVLVAVKLAAALTDPSSVAALGARLAGNLPDQLGAPAAARDLVAAGLRLTWPAAAAAAVPATLYGEGLRRAFTTLTRTRESVPGWRGRARLLPLFAVAPLLLLAVLVSAPWLARLFGQPGFLGDALGVYVAFLVDWVVLTATLGYVYRVVGPRSPRPPAVAWGAAATGSVLAGFLQGFVLFLALPVDLGLPFGGLTVIGAMVATGLWLFVLHAVVLIGYELTLRVDDRGGVPWSAPAPAGGDHGGRFRPDRS